MHPKSSRNFSTFCHARNAARVTRYYRYALPASHAALDLKNRLASLPLVPENSYLRLIDFPSELVRLLFSISESEKTTLPGDEEKERNRKRVREGVKEIFPKCYLLCLH